MRLYKRIIKVIFIAITFAIFLLLFYKAFLEDIVNGKRNIDFFSEQGVTLVVSVIILLVSIFHIHFFNPYEKNKVWRNTNVLEILGFILNFVYSSMFIIFGLMILFNWTERHGFVSCLMITSNLLYGGYSFLESVFIIRYLKRDINFELSDEVDNIGK